MINFCIRMYNDIFTTEFADTHDEAYSQKKAIRDTTIEAMRAFPDIEPAEIWKAVYSAHIHRKTGLTDVELIQRVISAENSWKKSSGHAFEEMIKLLGNDALEPHNIRLVLQKDLNHMIRDGEIHNEVRDISWLKEQVNSSVFDLYAIVTVEDRNFVFGCIQSKTSIRDRVTRDREPSLHAMQAFFWSAALVLDGDFLRLPKFQYMVNGGSTDYPQNGWHGMYVFSDKYTLDRIYSTDIDLTTFVDHARSAANYWLTQRQWFNHTWRA